MARTKQNNALVRGSEADQVQVTGAQGSYVFGRKRRKYVDFLAGWCVGNLGWDQREVGQAIRRFKGPDYVYPGYGYKPWEELAALLVGLAPVKQARCFRATGGSEAVDLAMQAAMLHTGRRGFVSIEDSYHGNTLGTLSIGASESRKSLKNLLPYCEKIEPPLDGKSAGRLEKLLRRRDSAAFVMEPISINQGVVAPEADFIERAQKACRRTGTLFIADEVACGFYRTGNCSHRSISGCARTFCALPKRSPVGQPAWAPCSPTAPVAKSLDEEGNAYSTYGWHPRSTEAALVSIRYMIRHRTRLRDHIERMADFFRQRLVRIDFKEVPALRVRGLAIALEFGDKKYVSALHARCRAKGLMLSSEGTILLLLPALNISRKTAQEGLDILQRCA